MTHVEKQPKGAFMMDTSNSTLFQQIALAPSAMFSSSSFAQLPEIRQFAGIEMQQIASKTPPALSPRAYLDHSESPAQLMRGSSSKGRTNRQAVEPLIADRLKRRPHDTAVEVARAVGCSTGLVGESPVWKLNQQRLRTARKHRIDPIGIKLNEHAVNAAGASRTAQLHDHHDQTSIVDAKIDEEERVLFDGIGYYQRLHPNATIQEIAAALKCTSGLVERRQAMLNRLAAQQADSQQEDIRSVSDGANSGHRQKWVAKIP
jgi:hypothetical protein